ncbi:hypothetical protein CAPTEDRAFT_216535 [Capitella teleta]|uniref:Ionotropic glutamate receptor L-glutamate and glycine-binding domain-containing protein n=1 Tax=Capitella teleta TaxID=283909 RepID=R7UUW6_CAPTE|nr:hypothetical protein CAPTEDRAFT_216535 [Capitella teleta]|eukprot:ELU07171.1 hypothetical protein CAPTEDRAFT_216535 [Capitella teleta]
MQSGIWPPKTVDDIFPLLKYGLNGMRLKVAVKTYVPFLEKSSTGVYSGMLIELLHLFAERLNFSYVLEEPRDGNWGVRDENGTWTGIIGQMQNKEADLSCAAITRSYLRSQVMDFASLPFHIEYRGFMYKRPNSSSALFGIIFRPLQYTVWLCVISTILFTAAAFWMSGISREDSLFTNRWQCIYFSCAAMLSQGFPNIPQSISGRTLSGFLWFFSITLAAVYSGNLTAFLAVSKLSTPFSTLEDIASQSEYQIGFTGGGYSEMFFRVSQMLKEDL